MAKPVLDRASLPSVLDRLGRLAPDTPRRWGTLDSTHMLRHLRFTTAMSLGEEEVPDQSVPILREILYVFAFRLFTRWPRGKIKAPDFVCPPADEPFEAQHRALTELVARFVDALDKQPDRVELNPILGPTPLRRWSRIHGLHIDHHLRQFGV